jgi:hypothetical protein
MVVPGSGSVKSQNSQPVWARQCACLASTPPGGGDAADAGDPYVAELRARIYQRFVACTAVRARLLRLQRDAAYAAYDPNATDDGGAAATAAAYTAAGQHASNTRLSPWQGDNQLAPQTEDQRVPLPGDRCLQQTEGRFARAQNWCPPVQDRCLPVQDRCLPVQDRCPPVEDRCLPVEDRCPPVDARCPPVDARCPPVDARCPRPDDGCPRPQDMAESQCAPPSLPYCPLPSDPPCRRQTERGDSSTGNCEIAHDSRPRER